MRCTAAGSFAWARDHLVERHLLIEHHRVQLARLTRRAVTDQLRIDLLHVVAELREPERVREPPRGIDRQHERALAATGRCQRERGCRGRLADAARADADQDPSFEQNIDQTSRHRWSLITRTA
jgi:hypothetical protein